MTLSSRNGIPFSVTSQSPAAELCTIADLATPCVTIDEAVVTRNLDRLSDYARSHEIGLRPHCKTHKSKKLASWQLERSAVGLTAAKVGEAEVFAEVCNNLLLAYPIVDAHRSKRVAQLAGRCDLKVAVDSETALQVLSRAASAAGTTVGILIDLDVGLHRTGAQSPAAASALAELASRLPGLNLRGLFCYPGHIWLAAAEQKDELTAVAELLEATLEDWRRRGLCSDIVSGGSTPTAYQSHLVPQLTEIRPGTYLFNDMNTVRGGYVGIDDCAARIHVTVVSDAIPGQVVIDAGSKTLAADHCVTHPESGHGHIVEYPDARLTKLSEEHGQVDVTACAAHPRLGERLTVIPNHICPCINLQDRVWLRNTNGAVDPISIEARGKLT